MKHFRITLAILLITTLSACATSSPTANEPKGIAALADDARLGDEVKKICFNRTIDGFYNAGRNTVVLAKGVSDDYIVEVRGICSNLRHAKSIAIDSTMSCITRGDAILVSTSSFSLDDGTGIGPDRCYIEKMHKWNKQARSAEKDKAEADPSAIE